jgi:hypothetical protein
MYTNKSIRLHNKSLGILEMIQTVTNRIEDNKRSIKLHDGGSGHWIYTRSFFEENLKKNVAIQYRLALYYVNVLNSTSQEGCKQVAKLLINS